MTAITRDNPDRDGAAGTRGPLARLVDYLGDLAAICGAAREAERLLSLSDAALARRGLARSDVMHTAFREYLGTR